VIRRARGYLHRLENQSAADAAARSGQGQLDFSPPPEPEPPPADALREALAGLNPDELTPKQALEALYALKRKA
jgi:DNA mismatch repair protein MutS